MNHNRGSSMNGQRYIPILTLIDICAFILLFLFRWFSNELEHMLTPFLIAPIYLALICGWGALFVANIILCLIKSKTERRFRPIPVIVSLLLTITLMFFPSEMAKIKLEHLLFEDVRMRVVEQYRSGEELTVPRCVSTGGEVKTKTLNNGKDVIVGFWQHEGMLSSFSLLYYTSVDSEDAIGHGGFSSDTDIISMDKIAPHWYYIVFE